VALMLAVAPVAAIAQAPNAYQAAVAARQSGNPIEAKRLLQQWLAEHPDDVDARLQLAYSDLAIGDLDAAQAGFEAVLAKAPDYQDARDGRALVAARRSSSSVERTGHFAVEGALSDLTGGARGWSELSADAELPIGPQATIGGRGSYYRRVGLEDVELIGRIGLHPSENLWLRGHLGATPHADFRPEVSVGGGADLRLSTGDATVLTFDASYERFPTQDVVTVNPGLVQYLSQGRAWITLRGIGVVADGGVLQVGGLLRGDYAPADGWRVFAGGANGPDTDLGVVTRVSSVFGGVEAPLADHFAVTGAIAHEWRKTGVDRTEFRLGIKTRF